MRFVLLSSRACLSLVFCSLLPSFACRQIFKTPSAMNCQDAADAFAQCAAISPSIEPPTSYNSITAALACDGQPDCLADYFTCIATAFQSSDCSTEEGSDAAMQAASDCVLPESDPQECPVDDLIGPPSVCGGTAPIIENVSCSYPGIQYSSADDMDLPLLQILVEAADIDGDLTSYILHLEIDSAIDGEVTPGAREYTVDGQTSDGTCDTDGTNITLDFYIKGGFPAYETAYEFFFVVEDITGLRSPQYRQVCTTPDAAGNPPQ